MFDLIAEFGVDIASGSSTLRARGARVVRVRVEVITPKRMMWLTVIRKAWSLGILSNNKLKNHRAAG